jgi:hypothetical protein
MAGGHQVEKSRYVLVIEGFWPDDNYRIIADNATLQVWTGNQKWVESDRGEAFQTCWVAPSMKDLICHQRGRFRKVRGRNRCRQKVRGKSFNPAKTPLSRVNRGVVGISSEGVKEKYTRALT